MFIIMKRNTIICKTNNIDQANCIIKMEQAQSKKMGYNTNGYEICELIKHELKDLKFGWFRYTTEIKRPNGQNEILYGEMFYKAK